MGVCHCQDKFESSSDTIYASPTRHVPHHYFPTVSNSQISFEKSNVPDSLNMMDHASYETIPLRIREGTPCTPTTLTSASTLLYSMDTDTLASLIKHLMENATLFAKYKDESQQVYQSILHSKLNGQMLCDLTTREIWDETQRTSIRRPLMLKICGHLRTMTDHAIETILNAVQNDAIDQTRCDIDLYTCRIITLPSYLKQLYIIRGPLRIFDRFELQIFVYVLCIVNALSEKQTNLLLQSFIQSNLNGGLFVNLTRLQFFHELKRHETQITGALCAKLHKLITTHGSNIAKYLVDNRIQLLCDADDRVLQVVMGAFPLNAHVMLSAMNSSMQKNEVDGMTLVHYYNDKSDLNAYLTANIKGKTITRLADYIWDDYITNEDKNAEMVKPFDRQELFNYFVYLYMTQIKEVIVRNNINREKCASLERKRLCSIFVSECHFGIGVATNIVDTIHGAISY